LAVLEHKEHGKVDVMRMRLASRTGPPNWAIEKSYIQLLDETGARSAAINELIGCLQTQWYRADSWLLLSELETKAGHSDQAANALAQARAYDIHLHGSSGTESRQAIGTEPAETVASPSGKKSSHKKSKEEATEAVPTPGGEQE
jgi:hypothetical protein